jgi:hypothetical protein
MIFFYFLIILFVINSILIGITTTFNCSKGGWHEWKEWNWKSGSFKESGFNINYKYCVNYKCKKCGKVKYWRNDE